MTQPEAFWTTLERYLLSFYADLWHGTQPGGFAEGGGWWWREDEGTLPLTANEWRSYNRLLRTAHQQLARDTTLSKAAIDSALKDAIFAAADLPETRDAEVGTRIQRAVDEFRAFIEGAGEEYECWIEVEGLDAASLPAEFGKTRFAVVGNGDNGDPEAAAEDKDRVGRQKRGERIRELAGDIQGRHVAIQRASARDHKSALLKAMREVQITVDCLNFFADIVPYNSARLRISHGRPGVGSSLRVATARDGSWLFSPQKRLPWEFSLDRLRELQGPMRDAQARVEHLLASARRSEIDELVLSAVRWVGRAVSANRTEDKFLFSAIALDCIVRPKPGHSVRQEISSRVARVLSGGGEERERLEAEIRRLYDIRSALVHDGSLEVTEDDRARVQTIALRTVVWALTSVDVDSATTLDDLEAYFKRLT